MSDFYLGSDEMRATASVLYVEYLSRPYNAAYKKFCSHDWELATIFSYPTHAKVVTPRPNHGLAHTVRVVHIFPLALRLLLKHRGEDASSVTLRDVHLAQYLLLFAVVGRECEIGWDEAMQLQSSMRQKGVKDFPNLYEELKRKSKEALRASLAKSSPASLQLSKSEMKVCESMLDLGPAAEKSILTYAMKLAHDVDIMRCKGTAEFDEYIEFEFVDALGVQGAKTLCDYMYQLNKATGDRCRGYGVLHDYELKTNLFHRCSTEIDYLLEVLSTVKQPAMPGGAFATTADEADVSPELQKDDLNESTYSSTMHSLIDDFKHMMNGDCEGDIFEYNQLRFDHSTVITRFKGQAKCPMHFLIEFELDHNVAANIYTSPLVYRELNVALCRRINDRAFVKMFTLLLADAIHHLDHDDVPTELYRGVGYSDELLRMYREHQGKVIYLYNFTSTSRDRSVAARFPESKNLAPDCKRTLLIFHVPAETKRIFGDVSQLSQFAPEKELLMAPNAGVRIDSVDLINRVIYLTVADVSHCPAQFPEKMCPEHKRLGFTVAGLKHHKSNSK